MPEALVYGYLPERAVILAVGRPPIRRHVAARDLIKGFGGSDQFTFKGLFIDGVQVGVAESVIADLVPASHDVSGHIGVIHNELTRQEKRTCNFPDFQFFQNCFRGVRGKYGRSPRMTVKSQSDLFPGKPASGDIVFGPQKRFSQTAYPVYQERKNV